LLGHFNMKQLDFIKKIYFNREIGTDGEKRAAEIIAQTVRSMSGTADFEEFTVVKNITDKTELVAHGKNDTLIECTSFGKSGSTPDEGITAPLFNGGNGEESELKGCENHIVFVNGIHRDLYRRLIEKGAVGFITFFGSIFDEKSKTDIPFRSLKQNAAKFGELPGVLVRASDALSLLKTLPILTLTVKQHEENRTSQNVVAEIKGSEKPDDIALFTAHYDSTPYSKGAWDNASGCANLMSLYSFYIKNQPKRTVRFIWCGGEEAGLLGSRAYVETHKDELEKIIFGYNIDMTGTVFGGNDMACITGDDSAKSILKYCADEIGFTVSPSSGMWPSDSASFANEGIPFLTFQRGGQGGMHSRNDVIEALSEDSLRKTTEYIRFLSNQMINSEIFPVKRSMPENLKDELERYFAER